jgi:site-specific DNA-methyltransferase (adenine-specific)
MKLTDKIEVNRAYNEDAVLVMNQMIQDGIVVDLIVTDPPYLTTSRGSNGNSGGMLQKEINKKGKVFEHNNTHVSVWANKLYELLKDSGHCYIMTNHKNLQEYLNVLTSVGFHFIKSLIWEKDNKIMGQFYMSKFEYILFFRKGEGIKINECGTPDILKIANKKTKNENGDNIHDTEKPIELMKILIKNSSKENEIVFEPFMGVGSTCIASKMLNRKYIGVEIDEKYHTIAQNRLDNVSGIFKEDKLTLF